mmetsp:Transcript_48945/g.130986  ORF Transcript_48945/g.130986 Transcript_48945/m.130986 type:complete len:149 (-) Transcript_48945:14-460(-)
MLKDANDRLALMQKLQRDSPAMPGAGMPAGVRPMSFAPGGMGGAPQLSMPSTIITLHGMFNMSQVNLAVDPEFFNDIHADVEQECRKYGSVVTVWADQSSTRGDVWVRFNDTTSASNCQRALDRRWFAGQQIIAEFTNEAAWSATVRG